MRFSDRAGAGEELARAVALHGPPSCVVYALPNGGVPVASPVAKAVGADLDILIVRKVGVPGHRELAMGAVGEGGVVARNEELIRHLGITPAVFDDAAAEARVELERRSSSLRPMRPLIEPRGRLAIVVDDGLATGASARAALDVVRDMGAGRVWLAVPVAPPDAQAIFAELAEKVIALEQPSDLGAVGRWYERFEHVDDDVVLRILAAHGLSA